MRLSARVLVAVLLVALVVGMMPGVANAGVLVSTSTLQSGQFYAIAPRISGKVAAWMRQSTSTSPYEVWVRRSNGTVKQLNVASIQSESLTVFGGRYVVWSQQDDDGVGGINYELIAYDDVTDQTTPLTWRPTPQIWPAGNGMTLVWVDQSLPNTLHTASITMAGTPLRPTLASERVIETRPGEYVADTCLYGSQVGFTVAPTTTWQNKTFLSRDLVAAGITTVGAPMTGDPSCGISNAWWVWQDASAGLVSHFMNRATSEVLATDPAITSGGGSNPAIYGNLATYTALNAAGTIGGPDVWMRLLQSGQTLQVSSGYDARYSAINGRRVLYTARPYAFPAVDNTWGVNLAQMTLQTDRVPGADRYEVAAGAARRAWGDDWSGITHVVIASGDDAASADPLAAAGLCWKYDAPLLLVGKYKWPAATATALTQIKAANPGVKVIVIGGAGSVPAARITNLAAIVGAGNVERLLATGDRYDLAAKIAERMRLGPGGRTFPADPVALIANGADPAKFFDALSLSAVSRASGNPILLVKLGWAPTATKNALAAMHPQGVVVAGGTGTVNAGAYTSVGGTTRWWGADRFATSKAVADGAIANGYCVPTSIALAAKLPDGLSGGAMVGRDRGVLLVTKTWSLSPSVGDFAAAHCYDIWDSTALGGTASLYQAAVTSLDAKLNP